MNPSLAASTTSEHGTRLSGPGLFWSALRARPLRVGLGLCVEYAMFAAAVGLALLLRLTRTPMAWLDRISGLRLRERIVSVLARLSPG